MRVCEAKTYNRRAGYFRHLVDCHSEEVHPDDFRDYLRNESDHSSHRSAAVAFAVVGFAMFIGGFVLGEVLPKDLGDNPGDDSSHPAAVWISIAGIAVVLASSWLAKLSTGKDAA